MQSLQSADLRGKIVLYRPDYNVPLKNGQIQDAFRIAATVPTLDYLREQKAKIVIASHMGRPDGHPVESLSLRPVAEYLANQYPKADVRMAHGFDFGQMHETIEQMREGDILLLPNVRFSPEEEANNEAFGRELANLAEVFVLDAFACAHRAHASIVRPAELLPSYPGFLMEKEVQTLGGLVAAPEKPSVVIMGGAKVSDKIDVIKTLGAHADALLIGGAMANTFLLAQHEPIGQSLAEPDKRVVAEELMHEFGTKLFLAPDYVKDGEGDAFRYLDIGPKAVELFKQKLAGAKTVFWNGSLGFTEQAPYDEGSKAIALYLAELTSQGVTTIVAGGDTVELVHRLGIEDRFTFVSTGGGAALELLAGDTLPGVAALK